jgi:hypothetical protein
LKKRLKKRIQETLKYRKELLDLKFSSSSKTTSSCTAPEEEEEESESESEEVTLFFKNTIQEVYLQSLPYVCFLLFNTPSLCRYPMIVHLFQSSCEVELERLVLIIEGNYTCSS